NGFAKPQGFPDAADCARRIAGSKQGEPHRAAPTWRGWADGCNTAFRPEAIRWFRPSQNACKWPSADFTRRWRDDGYPGISGSVLLASSLSARDPFATLEKRAAYPGIFANF